MSTYSVFSVWHQCGTRSTPSKALSTSAQSAHRNTRSGSSPGSSALHHPTRPSCAHLSAKLISSSSPMLPARRLFHWYSPNRMHGIGGLLSALASAWSRLSSMSTTAESARQIWRRHEWRGRISATTRQTVFLAVASPVKCMLSTSPVNIISNKIQNGGTRRTRQPPAEPDLSELALLLAPGSHDRDPIPASLQLSQPLPGPCNWL